MPQTSVGFQSDTPTRPGMALGAGHDKGYIVGGRAVKIVEVTVDTARNAHDYAYTSGGLTTDLAKTENEDIEATSGGAATVTSIRDLLIAAHLANANAARRADAYDSDAAKFKVEGREPGDDFTLSEADDDLSIEILQAASDDENIPFGHGVCAASGDGEVELPQIATTAAVAAVAKVMTATPTYSAGDEWVLNVLVLGKVYSGVVTMATSLAASLTAMAEALNDQLPADTVLVASDGSKLTFTSEVAGQDFDVTSGASDIDDAGNTVAVALATTTPNTAGAAASYALLRPFKGIALSAAREAQLPAQNDAVHRGRQSVPVRYEGPVGVACEPGISPQVGDKVYLRGVKSGTKLRGHWTNTPVTGETVEMTGVRWTDHVSPGDYGSTRVASLYVGSQAAAV